jgi:hypothetical protein
MYAKNDGHRWTRRGYWFLSLYDAWQKMEDWRRDHNEARPNSTIGNKAPISRLNSSSAPPPAGAKHRKIPAPASLVLGAL